jgi:hypothetical protein
MVRITQYHADGVRVIVRHTVLTGIVLGFAMLGLAGCDQGESTDSSPAMDTSSGQTAAVPAAGQEMDQRLIGRWRRTQTYTSGQFTAAVDFFMNLKADGTYESYRGSAAAGGADSTMVSGKGNVNTGTWKTERKVLYTSAAGTGAWGREGPYLVDAGHLMINKVVWERQ